MHIAERWPLAEALCAHGEFAHDRMLPLMIWYGIEPAIPRNRARALRLIAASQVPIVRQYASRRLTEDIESEPGTVNALVALAEQSSPDMAKDIVVGMAEALRGWSKAPQPAAWTSAASKLAAGGSADVKQHVQELGVVFGDGRAIDELRAMVANGDADPNARRQALRAMLAGRPADMAAALQDLSADRVMAIEAIRGLALYDDPHTPERVFKNWNLLGPAERAEAITTFCSRPAYARALLELVRELKIAKTDVSAFHARRIREFDDPQLSKDLAEVWGEVRTSPADKRALIERFKSQITPQEIAHAQPAQGRALFQKSCANCHVLYGVGRKVGPDLTGSNRKNLDYLLENVIDPSASVGADFRSWIVALDDGRVLNGVISEQTERTLTLQTDKEPVTVDRRSIAQMKQTANSLMPDGMLEQLSNPQVRDLVAYLVSVDQVDLPPDAVAAEPSR
jgi:putative heme-binding domain-containing protein